MHSENSGVRRALEKYDEDETPIEPRFEPQAATEKAQLFFSIAQHKPDHNTVMPFSDAIISKTYHFAINLIIQNEQNDDIDYPIDVDHL